MDKLWRNSILCIYNARYWRTVRSKAIIDPRIVRILSRINCKLMIKTEWLWYASPYSRLLANTNRPTRLTTASFLIILSRTVLREANPSVSTTITTNHLPTLPPCVAIKHTLIYSSTHPKDPSCWRRRFLRISWLTSRLVPIDRFKILIQKSTRRDTLKHVFFFFFI